MPRPYLIILLLSILPMTACQQNPPLPVVERVDLNRFMGDWYVIAHIPTWPERNATNAIENYELAEDGTVATTFTFYPENSSNLKTMTPTGFPDESRGNAVWGMQFIWPIKADYRISYLDDDYQYTIITRKKRDYSWIMARQPIVDDATYAKLVLMLKDFGYDTENLRKVPQRWE